MLAHASPGNIRRVAKAVRDLSFAVPLDASEQSDLARVLDVFERTAAQREDEASARRLASAPRAPRGRANANAPAKAPARAPAKAPAKVPAKTSAATTAKAAVKATAATASKRTRTA